MATISPDFSSAIPTKLGLKTQAMWDYLLDIIGDDPALIMIFYTTIWVIAVYWTYAGIFSIIDITNRPRWLLRYKIQPDQNIPINKEKFWKAVRQVLFNQLVITPAFLYVCYKIYYYKWTPTTVRQLPTLKTFFIDVGLMALLEEPFLYYAHRLLHHRTIYKYIHKKHHEWTAPVAAITFYCHPVEQIAINVGPVMLSAILINAHVTAVWTFIFLGIVNSMTDHTGYSFPFPFYKSSVVFHDYHHAKFNYNFGVFGWLDKLHGTFRESTMGWKANATKRAMDNKENTKVLKKQKIEKNWKK